MSTSGPTRWRSCVRLDFVDVIPGHGDPFKGKERIDWFQAYLRDLWRQGSTAFHDQKVHGCRRGEAASI